MLACAAPAAAQAPGSLDSLTPTTLDPLVTTATRDARSLTELPAAVSVADTVSLRQGRTVGLNEALRMLPGVQAPSRYGTEEVAIGIRGSAARSRQAVRGTGVLLDGVLLNESDGVARLDLIELSAMRQVEVVRGPGSALYAASSGGVVNLVSRTGRDSRGLTLRSQYGSFDSQKFDGYLGDTFAGGRGSLFLNGSYTTSDGYRAHSDGRVIRTGLNADHWVAERTRVTLEANGSDLETRLPGPLTQAEADASPDMAAPPAVAYGFGRGDIRYRAGTRVEHAWGADGTSSATGYFFYGGRTLRFPIVGQRVDLNLHRVQTGGRARAKRVARAPIDLVAGADYDHVFGIERRWVNQPDVRPDSLLDDGYLSGINLGLYGLAEWHPTPSVDLTAGLRWDNVTYSHEGYLPTAAASTKDTTFSQASPKFTASWHAVRGKSVYASVARGFEVPAFGEIAPLPSSYFAPVGPKSLWNYEVGTHLLLGRRVLADAAVFYADVTGEFVPRTGANGLAQPANASKSRNVGVELALTALATDWLELFGSYTYSDFKLLEYRDQVTGPSGMPDTVDFSGNRMPGIPRHRVTGEVRLRPVSPLEVSVQLEWQGTMYVETGNVEAGTVYFDPDGPGNPAPTRAIPFRSVPARALVHLAARWQAGPVGVFGGVENALGTRVTAAVVANDATGRFYEPGPGAVLTLGVSFAAWPHGVASPTR